MASVIANGLICAVCFGHLEEPKQLVCGHTFCKKCLEGILKSQSQLTCPLCREITSIPHGDVAKLPTDMTLKKMVEDLKKKKVQIVDADDIEITLTGELHHQKEDCMNIKTCKLRVTQTFHKLSDYLYRFQKFGTDTQRSSHEDDVDKQRPGTIWTSSEVSHSNQQSALDDGFTKGRYVFNNLE